MEQNAPLILSRRAESATLKKKDAIHLRIFDDRILSKLKKRLIKNQTYIIDVSQNLFPSLTAHFMSAFFN